MFKQIQTTRFHLLCALLPARVHPKFLSPRSILFPTIKLFTLPFAFLRSIFRRSMLPLSVPCVCCGFVLVTPSFVTSKHEILELHCLSACVFYVAVDTLCVCFLSLGSQQESNMQIHSSNPPPLLLLPPLASPYPSPSLPCLPSTTTTTLLPSLPPPLLDAATEPDAAPPRSFLLDLPCFATATEPDAGPYPLLLPFSSSRSRLSTSLPLSTLPPLHHNDHPCSRPSLLHSYFPGSAARGRSP